MAIADSQNYFDLLIIGLVPIPISPLLEASRIEVSSSLNTDFVRIDEGGSFTWKKIINGYTIRINFTNNSRGTRLFYALINTVIKQLGGYESPKLKFSTEIKEVSYVQNLINDFIQEKKVKVAFFSKDVVFFGSFLTSLTMDFPNFETGLGTITIMCSNEAPDSENNGATNAKILDANGNYVLGN